jgi:hypothetical protein
MFVTVDAASRRVHNAARGRIYFISLQTNLLESRNSV